MQRNPLQPGSFDSGLTRGSLLVQAFLEKTGVCGGGSMHDAHQKWDSHRIAYFACELRQPGFFDRKSTPSWGSCFLPDWLSLAIARVLDLEER